MNERLEKYRKKNIIRNIYINAISTIFRIFISFIIQKIFLRNLGVDVMGLNVFFSGIVTFLSMVEMGIPTSILYSLYKPVSENNWNKISGIMNFYKKIFRIVALVFLFLNIIVLLFLPYFNKKIYTLNYNIPIIFSLILVTYLLPYVYGYKKILFSVFEKNYIVLITSFCVDIFISSLQIIILIVYKNYYYYLIILFFKTFLENTIINIMIKKNRYIIKNINIENDDKLIIIKNIKAGFIHKISEVVVFNTDLILIAKFTTLAITAKYSNYIMIVSGLTLLMEIIFAAINAPIGNIIVNGNSKKLYKIYSLSLYANIFIVSFASISIFFLSDPFISVWIGEEFLLNKSIVYIICGNFFISRIRRITIIFKNGFGLFQQDRAKSILEAILNLILSIILGNYYGLFGVLLATLISSILLPLWIEPYFLFRDGLKLPFRLFIKKMSYYFCLTALSFYICKYLISIINISNNILAFFIYGIIIFIITLLIFIIFNIKSEVLKNLRRIIKKIRNR